MKQCRFCNTMIPNDAKICPNCRKSQSDIGGAFAFVLISLIVFVIIICLVNSLKKKSVESNGNDLVNRTTTDQREVGKPTIQVQGVEETTGGENIESAPSHNIADVEITFKDIPWGTTFSEADSMLSQLNLWNISGEGFKQYSVDDILIGDYKGIDFEYSGINVISNAFNKEQTVAGYTTSDITLYFVFIPVNGYLTYVEDDAILYGAQYEFEPTDLARMYEDLKGKLVSLYGDPYKTSEDSDIFGNKYTYTYWRGVNDTELVLRSLDSSKDTTNIYDDKIYISYAWRRGDTLLKNASNAVKMERLDAETGAQESGSTEGL